MINNSIIQGQMSLDHDVMCNDLPFDSISESGYDHYKLSQRDCSPSVGLNRVNDVITHCDEDYIMFFDDGDVSSFNTLSLPPDCSWQGRSPEENMLILIM